MEVPNPVQRACRPESKRFRRPEERRQEHPGWTQAQNSTEVILETLALLWVSDSYSGSGPSRASPYLLSLSCSVTRDTPNSLAASLRFPFACRSASATSPRS